MNKIHDERKYWGKPVQTKDRTLRVNAYGRNEFVKNWLQNAVLDGTSGVSVDEAIKMMTNFDWLRKK
jgi:hypothetical protein